MRKFLKNTIWNLTFLIFFLLSSLVISADGENAFFGSEAYEWEIEEISYVGVYVEANQNMDFVELYVYYDAEMLEYYAGGEFIIDGQIRISEEYIGSQEYMQMLQFIPKMAGTTTLQIAEAYIINEYEEEVEVNPVSVMVNIPVSEGNALEGLLINGEPILNFIPEIVNYSITVGNEIDNLEIIIIPADREIEISNTNLREGKNEIEIITLAYDGTRARYVLDVTRNEKAIESERITEGITEGITEDEVSSTTNEDDEEISQKVPEIIQAEKRPILTKYSLLIIGVLLGLIFLIIVLVIIRIKKPREKKKRNGNIQPESKATKKRRKRQQKRKRKENKGSRKEISKDKRDKKKREIDNKIEIEVKNVTMCFRKEKDESSSIKEHFIKTIKGQHSYEDFKALDDVSFTIKQGEVVGIIGTNGSGKSTILKIIAGALAPTEGKVSVNRKKVQLLTLGTGFDFELTGKENVYLNGALIGYTKEFIDEKYDEIVKFAELEGFMEEKVKNYSSGMVSRLGFSIATIRNTPEILILDEVLSVGDMFFKKKSEQRIREMINSGSTVLIVSHSPSVIQKNCSKAVWIEKGILKAVGEPNEVCKAYERMNEN